VFRSVNATNSKASASVLAVSERQALETLSRDEKTASRTLTQVRAKNEELLRNQERLRGDEQTQKASKSEVLFSSLTYPACSLYSQSSRKSLLLSRVSMRTQSKNMKTSRVSGQGSGISFFSKHLPYAVLSLFCSRLETETNEKLADVYQRLLQAGVDRNESEREAKLKETLASLQRIFPGKCRLPCPRKSALTFHRRPRARGRPLQTHAAQVRDSRIRYTWAQYRCCRRG